MHELMSAPGSGRMAPEAAASLVCSLGQNAATSFSLSFRRDALEMHPHRMPVT